MNSPEQVNAHLLAETIRQRLGTLRFGLLIRSVFNLDASALYNLLQPDLENAKLRLALVNYTLHGPYDAAKVTTAVEQAIAWRNEPRITEPIVVLLNPHGTQEKVHSLELFEPLTDEDFRRSIARQGTSITETAEERVLWSVLARKAVGRDLALVAEQMAAFYAARMSHEDVGDALPYLGLLRDPQLLTFANSRDQLIARLKSNYKLTERLRRIDKKVTRTLAHALDNEADRFQAIFIAIRSFTQRPGLATLQDQNLTLEAVETLFNAPKAATVELAPFSDIKLPSIDPRRSQDTVLAWMLSKEQQDQELLHSFASDVNSLFKEEADSDEEPPWSDKEAQKLPIILPTGQEIEEVYPDKKERHLLETLMRQSVQNEVWGGTMDARDALYENLPVQQLFADTTTSPPFLSFRPLVDQGTAITDEHALSLLALFRALDQVLEVPEEKSLSRLLQILDDKRRTLAPYRMRFLYRPSDPASFVLPTSDPRLCEEISHYIEAYERLSLQIQEIYHRALDLYPDTIEQATALFLALDTVIIARRNNRLARQGGDVVLLTTLHPLHLWKWLELARRLQAQDDLLSEAERTFLGGHIAQLPTLLNTFTLHPAMFPKEHFSALYHLEEPRLVLAGELNNSSSERTVGIPYYQPVAHHVSGDQDLDRERLAELLKDFLVLYPPARLGLAIAIINPPVAKSFLAACQDLAADGLLQGALVQIYRTDPQALAYERRLLESDDLMSQFRDDSHWTFQVNLRATDYKHIAEDIKYNGFHLIILCDPSEAIVQPVLRVAEGQPSPFGVPTHLVYDAIRDTVRRVPAPTGGLFDVYAGLRNALTSELSRRTLGVGNRLVITDHDLEALASSAPWLVILDHPNGTLELPQLGHQWLWQVLKQRTLAVYSLDETRWAGFLNELSAAVPVFKDVSLVEPYLGEALLLLPDGLLSTLMAPPEASSATHKAVSTERAFGLLTVVTILHHYRRISPTAILLPLNSRTLAQAFNVQLASSGSASLLLAVWHEKGQLYLDVVLARAFDVMINPLPPLYESVTALAALQVVAHTLQDLFAADIAVSLLGPIRREILRDQLSVAIFAPSRYEQSDDDHSQITQVKAEWAYIINRLFDYVPRIRLQSIHVMLNETATLPPQVVNSGDFYGEVLQLSPITQDALFPTAIASIDRDTLMEMHPSPSIDHGVEDTLVDSLTKHQSNANSVEEVSMAHPASLTPKEDDAIRHQAGQLQRALNSYGIAVAGIDIEKTQIGPRVIRYWVRLQPPAGRLSEVQKYAVDIARELGSKSVPLVDNIPGERYIGIDLPREEPQIVPLAPALATLPIAQPFSLMLAMGVDAAGQEVQADLVRMPHLLVAGTTGSGKTTFLATLIISLAMYHPPTALQLMLVDPKQTDLVIFDRLPHLRDSRVFYNAAEAIETLRIIIDDELEARTILLAEARCPNNLEYNRRNPEQQMPWLVIVVDEFADIMLTLSRQERNTFERQIGRLAGIGRAKGIHLILATQRPTADIITGTIKANFPVRISFRLPSLTDSRTILDRGGAEHLLGHGDMLALMDGELQRLQGYYAPYEELEHILRQISA